MLLKNPLKIFAKTFAKTKSFQENFYENKICLHKWNLFAKTIPGTKIFAQK
jgi:hypothetical protein